MKLESLEILRCPFCGGRLRGYSLEIKENEVQAGVLGCACCAYPVVAGIPFLRTGQIAQTALRLVDSGKRDEPLATLLGLNEERMDRFKALRGEQGFSYQTCLKFLSPTPEGTYFLYRFSDPTFLVSEALLRSLCQSNAWKPGRVLDLCGGSGHLARTLCELSETVWLGDLEFWKLWLAREFVAPKSEPVCCDASQPLPFARESFSVCVCSDAFPFIWTRRALAGEMRRLVGHEGIVLATQLHKAPCENASEGSPLEPAGWRELFEEVPARLFKESTVLDAIVEARAVSLSTQHTDSELAGEPALIAISVSEEGVYRDYELPERDGPLTRLVMNPLYRVHESETKAVLTLQFPSEFYEAEFGQCRRYLPENFELSLPELQSIRNNNAFPRQAELVRRRVLLELPGNYL